MLSGTGLEIGQAVVHPRLLTDEPGEGEHREPARELETFYVADDALDVLPPELLQNLEMRLVIGSQELNRVRPEIGGEERHLVILETLTPGTVTGGAMLLEAISSFCLRGLVEPGCRQPIGLHVMRACRLHDGRRTRSSGVSPFVAMRGMSTKNLSPSRRKWYARPS